MRRYILIILILFLTFILRVYRLGEYPSGFTWDEAALGYNAYSILKTGRDEYGKLLPVIFKSFGDYKPGFYVYLTIPSIFLFGLNEFAIRFPSVVFGTLIICALYLLIKEFFGASRERLAILAALVAATNPWLIHFSRGAWEANLAVLETVFAVYFFIKFIKTDRKIDGLFCSLFFGLTFLTYQGAKAFTVLLVFGLGLFWLKEIRKVSFKKGRLLVLPFLLCFLFVYLGLLRGTGGRIKVMSLFSYRRPAEDINLIKAEGGISEKWLFPVFHGENLAFFRGFLGRYFNYFSGRFLLFEGDWGSKRHGPPYTGTILLVSLPFLILGIFCLFSKKRNKLENLFLYWLLVSPVPAALTRDSIQAVRSLPMAIPLIFLIATGIDYGLSLVKSRRIIFVGGILVSFIFLLNLVYYFDLYFVHYPIYSARDWGYGYKEISLLLGEKTENYKKIVMTSKLGQPYIFYLFYNRYDPKKYQSQAFLTENSYGDVGEVKGIDNIEFRTIYFPADRGLSNALLIGDEFELPLSDILGNIKFQILREIKYPDGSIPFRMVEIK